MSEQQFTPQEYSRIKVFPKVSSLVKMLKNCYISGIGKPMQVFFHFSFLASLFPLLGGFF